MAAVREAKSVVGYSRGSIARFYESSSERDRAMLAKRAVKGGCLFQPEELPQARWRDGASVGRLRRLSQVMSLERFTITTHDPASPGLIASSTSIGWKCGEDPSLPLDVSGLGDRLDGVELRVRASFADP
jgi:hypothetical protein